MPVEFTQKLVSTTRLEAKTARVNLTDSKSHGLVLRGGPTGLTWQHRIQLKGRTERLVIGSVDRWTISEARGIANAATAHVRTFGKPVDEAWLQLHLVSIGKIAAPAAPDVVSSFPTFAQGRTEYLEWVKTCRSEATETTYRGFLEMTEMKALDERRLPTITRDEIVNIIIAVHATGRESSSENLCRTIRPMWKWLGADGRRLRWGVDKDMLVGIQAPDRTYANPDPDSDTDEDDDDPWSTAHYVPEIDELGLIIATARSGIMSAIVGNAVELTCWTVQRRRTIVHARLQDFFDLGDGTGLWRIPAIYRKGGRRNKKAHTIPLPAPAWNCVMKSMKDALERDKDTRWLFPAARPRKAGGPVKNTNESTLTHIFKDIPDCGATAHAVRRTMGTHGEALLGFARIDSGTVMDHSESKKASERITSRTAGTGTHDVTGVHYSLHDGTHHTWPIMRAWCDALQKSIVSETSRLDHDRLARGFGDRAYRLGGPPAKMLVAGPQLEGEELSLFMAEREAREKVIRSRVIALGKADEDA